MTPEQKREQWLKRILPALVVVVVYFAIISPSYVVPKSKKAEDQYMGLVHKGINVQQLSSLGQQQSTVQAAIAKIENEGKEIKGALQAKNGFLSRNGSVNAKVEVVSVILADNNLQVLDEQRNDKPGNDQLPGSLRETQTWLKDLLSLEPDAAASAANKPATSTAANPKPTEATKGLNLWTIHYVGTYLDNYRALSTLAGSDLKALRVSLTMHPYHAENESAEGKQEWVLTLWI